MKKLWIVLVATLLLGTSCMADYVKNIVMHEDPVSSFEAIDLVGGGTLPVYHMNERIDYLGFCTNEGIIGVSENSNIVSELVYVDTTTFETSTATDVSGAYMGDCSSLGNIVVTTPTGDETSIGMIDMEENEYIEIATHDRMSIVVQPHFTDDGAMITYALEEDGQPEMVIYEVQTGQLTSVMLDEILPEEWIGAAQNVSDIHLHRIDDNSVVFSVKHMSVPYIVVNTSEDAYALQTATDTSNIFAEKSNVYHINKYSELVRVDLAQGVSYKMATDVENFSLNEEGNALVYQTLDENGCSMLYLLDVATGQSGLADVREAVQEFEISPDGNKLFVKYTDNSSFEPVEKYVVREF